MGCDIHGVVEYKEYDDWSSLYKAVDLGRDYSMFGALAGVRERDVECLYEPKGFPDGSSAVDEGYGLLVVEDEKMKDEDWSECIKESEALELVKRGKPLFSYYNSQYMADPDWHTPSYLSYTELENVLTMFKENTGRSNTHIESILGSMKPFHKEGTDVRFVFWFDN